MIDPFNHPVIQHVAKCKPVIHNIPFTPWSFYMYATIAAVVSAAVAGVIGYFVGKRGLTGTQSDLKNAATEVSKVTSEITTAAQTVHP